MTQSCSRSQGLTIWAGVTRVSSKTKKAFDCRGREILLGEEIGRGGFGRVHAVGVDRAAKILARTMLRGRRARTADKLRDLVVAGREACHAVRFQVMFPLHLLRNSSDLLVGYVMPRVRDGVPLNHFARSPKVITPGWDFGARRAVAIQLAEIVDFMHGLGFVIGDLSPNNFLVSVGPGGDPRLHLIDVDSVQFSRFVERTRTPRYMRPEEVSGEVEVRSCIESDLHALSFVIFEVLMRGVSPYAHIGGGSMSENIARERFPYKVRRPHRDAPDRFRGFWSAVSTPLREAFVDCFAHRDRLPANRWAQLLLDSPEAPAGRRSVHSLLQFRRRPRAS